VCRKEEDEEEEKREFWAGIMNVRWREGGMGESRLPSSTSSGERRELSAASIVCIGQRLPKVKVVV
jgi:hypothetical protein